MDGASKFVRGDAIAGLIITVLNLVCGIALATWQGMALADAGDKYSKLTIGDGLVSQIPALFISTAAAVLVTKNTSEQSLGTDLLMQVSSRPRAMIIAAGMLFVLGLLPGMPRVPFFVLSDPFVALRSSNAILIALMFAAGWRWAGYTGGSRLGTASAMTLLGVGLVGVSLALGG